MNDRQRKLTFSDIEAWARYSNDGNPGRIGPESVANESREPTDDPVDRAAWSRVNATLLLIGKGVYYPKTLIELLRWVHYDGRKIEEFALFTDPGHVIPARIVELGARTSDLVPRYYRRFVKLHARTHFAGIEEEDDAA